MIQLNNIYKRFQENQVLNGASLTIEDGSVTVLIGPSGSGKTTLLRCINFLEHADDGTLVIGDDKVNFAHAGKKEIAQIRKDTAMVFQNYNLFYNKTALENITEGLIYARKEPKAQAIEKARALLEKVGLSEKADQYPRVLSGGQQQRVGIARALALNPKILLLDEPTSALDPELVGEVLSVIRQVASEGQTMLVVTHEMAFAREIATKIIFMEHGKVVEEGSPDEIFEDPKQERTKEFLRRVYTR